MRSIFGRFDSATQEEILKALPFKFSYTTYTRTLNEKGIKESNLKKFIDYVNSEYPEQGLDYDLHTTEVDEQDITSVESEADSPEVADESETVQSGTVFKEELAEEKISAGATTTGSGAESNSSPLAIKAVDEQKEATPKDLKTVERAPDFSSLQDSVDTESDPQLGGQNAAPSSESGGGLNHGAKKPRLERKVPPSEAQKESRSLHSPSASIVFDVTEVRPRLKVRRSAQSRKQTSWTLPLTILAIAIATLCIAFLGWTYYSGKSSKRSDENTTTKAPTPHAKWIIPVEDPFQNPIEARSQEWDLTLRGIDLLTELRDRRVEEWYGDAFTRASNKYLSEIEIRTIEESTGKQGPGAGSQTFVGAVGVQENSPLNFELISNISGPRIWFVETNDQIFRCGESLSLSRFQLPATSNVLRVFLVIYDETYDNVENLNIRAFR